MDNPSGPSPERQLPDFIKEWTDYGDETRASFLRVSCDAGAAICSYDKTTGEFEIGNLQVSRDNRKRGIGTRLVELSKEEAERVGAGVITARITSKESLLTFQSVFGPESITIDQEGGFLDSTNGESDGDKSTLARLYYAIQEHGA